MKMPEKKRCFLGAVDGSFDPAKDFAIGPWCFRNPEDARGIQFIEPYERSEILALHKNLYGFACHVVEIEARKLSDAKEQKRFFLKSLPYYLFFVYFAFSRYRLVKNFLSIHDVRAFSFEKQGRYVLKDDVFQYTTVSFSAHICSDVLEILQPDGHIGFFEKASMEISSHPSEEGGLREGSKERIKRFILRFNDFRNIKGIYWRFGIFLSVVRRLANIFLWGNKESPLLFPENTYETSAELDEFHKIFQRLEKKYIPDFRRNSKGYVALKKVALINSPSELIFNAASQSYAIEAYLNGSRVTCIQHGACYGTVKNHFRRELEYNYSNFVGWGQRALSYRPIKNYRQMPVPYLSKIADQYQPRDSQDWLWMTSVHMKTGDGLEYPYGTQIIEYDARKLAFYNLLSGHLQEHLLYKALPYSYHDLEDTLREALPWNKVIVQANSLVLMKDARFLLLDAYSTAFYEAVSMNVPVILCLMEYSPFFEDHVQDLFNRFRNHNIIFDDSEACAHFINAMEGEDMWKWWSSPDIQSLRHEFIRFYANNEPYKQMWLREVARGI